MKTIIHIGQHKTGTTSIQKFLEKNAATFKENGLYVPLKLSNIKSTNHGLLNVHSLADDRYSIAKERYIAKHGKNSLVKLKRKLENEVESIYRSALDGNCDRVIWSNEGLYLLNSVSEYEKLASLFRQYSSSIEVVCCFRDKDSYRNSYIKQLEKTNIKTSENKDSYRYIEPDSWIFNYKQKQELLSKVFDKCTFFDYNSEDNVKAFLEAIDCIYPVQTDEYKLNITGKESIDFRTWLNRFLTFLYIFDRNN